MKRALLIASGDAPSHDLLQKLWPICDLHGCADGGYRVVRDGGWIPEILLGDFDSLEQLPSVQELEKDGTTLISLPREKDLTDTEALIEEFLAQGVEEIYLTGVLGSRWDHSLANIGVLERLLHRGIRGDIFGGNCHIRLFGPGEHLIRKDGFPIVSFLPWTGQARLTLQGFYYDITYQELRRGTGQGISNVFNGEEGVVRIDEGLVLGIWSSDE